MVHPVGLGKFSKNTNPDKIPKEDDPCLKTEGVSSSNLAKPATEAFFSLTNWWKLPIIIDKLSRIDFNAL